MERGTAGFISLCVMMFASFSPWESFCMGQEVDPPAPDSERERKPPVEAGNRRDGRGRLRLEIERMRDLREQMRKELKLRDDQLGPINELFEKHNQAITEQFKEAEAEREKQGPRIRELRKTLTEARKSGDREETKRVRRELRQLSGLSGLMKLHRRFQAAVLEQLDEEQAKVFKKLVRDSFRPQRGNRTSGIDLVVLSRALGKIDLTPEQTDATRNHLRAHRQALRGADRKKPELQAKLAAEVRAKILGELTPEQVVRLEETEKEIRKKMRSGKADRRRQRSAAESTDD